MVRRRRARPLAGRRIVITRRREQTEGLREALRKKGATVVEFPTIALATPRSWRPLDETIRRLKSYNWVVFTSANGVDSFWQRLARQGKGARALRRARIAAIGPATAAALKRHRVRATVVPDEYRAEGLIKALEKEHWQGQRVLLARAAAARAVLPQALRRQGARVDVVDAYRTVLPPVGKRRIHKVFGRRKPDAITFTSSSTVRNFFALLGRPQARRALASVAVASIGPITSRTARALGLRVGVEANPYTVPALVTALEKYFHK